jgi:hypothetical protein
MFYLKIINYTKTLLRALNFNLRNKIIAPGNYIISNCLILYLTENDRK